MGSSEASSVVSKPGRRKSACAYTHLMAETKQAPAATKTKMALSPAQEQPEPGPLMGVRVRLNPSLKQEQLMVSPPGLPASLTTGVWGCARKRGPTREHAKTRSRSTNS